MSICKEADIIVVKGNKTFFHKAIGFFTRSYGEKKTIGKHIAGVVLLNAELHVLEALDEVTITSLDEWLESHSNFEIWRLSYLNANQRDTIANEAVFYEGKAYGWWKLLGHVFDGMINKISKKKSWFFRKLFTGTEYPICSQLWALAYKRAIGYYFHKNYKYVDPDHMRDHMKNSIYWEKILETE